MLTLARCSLVAWGLLAPAVSQLQVEGSFVADTPLHCEVVVFVFQRFEQTLPRGTDLTPGVTLTASSSRLIATTRTTYSNTARGLTAVILEEATAYGPYGSASAGPPLSAHETVLALRAPVLTLARLVITSASSGTRTKLGGWSRDARIDVGDDGSDEVTGSTGRFEQVVALGAADLRLRTRTRLGAGTGDSTGPIFSRATVTIQVLPLTTLTVSHEAATPLAAVAWLRTNSLGVGSMLAPTAVVDASYGEIAASYTATLVDTPGSVALRIVEQGTTAPTFPRLASVGPHETVLTLRADPPRVLRFDLEATSTVGAPGTSTHLAQIDVGDDRTFELTSVPGRTVIARVEALVDARGLRIRTRTHGATDTGGASAAFAGDTRIAVSPSLQCTAVEHGAACGAVLTAIATLDNRLDLDLVGAPPGAFGKLALGFTPTDWPLPLSTCRLWVDPVVVVPIQADARGRALHSLAVPPGVPLTFFAQDVLLSTAGPSLELVASNGVRVACQ